PLACIHARMGRHPQPPDRSDTPTRGWEFQRSTGQLTQTQNKQLVELDDPFLVLGVVVPEQRSADHEPFRVAVEGLGLVGDRGDLLAQLRFGKNRSRVMVRITLPSSRNAR